jgi:hypothetical protein
VCPQKDSPVEIFLMGRDLLVNPACGKLNLDSLIDCPTNKE